jgi:hypothetical protein
MMGGLVCNGQKIHQKKMTAFLEAISDHRKEVGQQLSELPKYDRSWYQICRTCDTLHAILTKNHAKGICENGFLKYWTNTQKVIN